MAMFRPSRFGKQVQWLNSYNLDTLSMQACEHIDAVTGLLEILDNVRDEQGFDNDCFDDKHLSAMLYAMIFVGKAASGSIAELRTHIPGVNS